MPAARVKGIRVGKEGLPAELADEGADDGDVGRPDCRHVSRLPRWIFSAVYFSARSRSAAPAARSSRSSFFKIVMVGFVLRSIQCTADFFIICFLRKLIIPYAR
jgi:hypothetical protein